MEGRYESKAARQIGRATERVHRNWLNFLEARERCKRLSGLSSDNICEGRALEDEEHHIEDNRLESEARWVALRVVKGLLVLLPRLDIWQ
jgi:hypothetical protein